MTSIRQGVLPFKLEMMDRDDCVTAFGGLPLVTELFHKFGLPSLISRTLKLKQKGWSESQLLKSLVLLVVAGGNHMEDLEMLRCDKALQDLVKSEEGLPSVKAVERFLKMFHDEALMQARPSRDEAKAWVPKESKALKSFAKINENLVKRLIRMSKIETVTIENDATVVQSYKRESFGTYKGGSGYLPVIATIAELGIVLRDEFRDGNVTPSYRVTNFFKKCLKTLPKELKHIRARLDGAYYEHELIKYMNDQKVEFTITGEKSLGIMRWIKAIPEDAWKPLTKVTQQGIVQTDREYTELDWSSAAGTRELMESRTYRYIVTRKRQEQWEMFEHSGMFDTAEKDRYTLIVSNMDWQAGRLIHWHNERAGSIEHTIDSIKNDFAGCVLPCAEFGANAAWWRIQCLAHNLVRALQIHALPEEFVQSRMKKLRLHLFCIAGRVVRTGRQMILKLISNHPTYEKYKEARLKVLQLAIP